MTHENFTHAYDAAESNGYIDIDYVVAIKAIAIAEKVEEHKLPDAFKRQEILPHLKKYVFIIYFDKFGNGYTRIIY